MDKDHGESGNTELLTMESPPLLPKLLGFMRNMLLETFLQPDLQLQNQEKFTVQICEKMPPQSESDKATQYTAVVNTT